MGAKIVHLLIGTRLARDHVHGAAAAKHGRGAIRSRRRTCHAWSEDAERADGTL